MFIIIYAIQLILNVGSNYNGSTGAFTAPKTGLYCFSTNVFTINEVIATAGILRILVTGLYWLLSNDYRPASALRYGRNGTIVCKMTAGDTAFPAIQIIGEASNVVAISGDGTTANTWFSGYFLG